jgi:hypothetical protein
VIYGKTITFLQLLDYYSSVFRVIRSLGLTILAVAKGKFPIELSDYDRKDKQFDLYVSMPSNNDREIIGGAKGYWAMIQVWGMNSFSRWYLFSFFSLTASL